MAVKFTKPEINVREKLAELDKPSGIAGEAMLRAETPQEQFNLIGAGRRNLVINGANQVNQRGTVTGLNTAAFTYGGPDRRNLYVNQAGGAAFSISQGTSGPDQFIHTCRIDCTTAGGALTGGQEIKSEQAIEAYDVSGVGFGTPSAKSLTVSFWVKSNQAATYVLWLYRADGSRHNSDVYSINSANTWEFKTLTFAPDHSNTVAVDNSTGLGVAFILNTGPTFSNGTSPKGNWQALTSGNRYAGQTATIGSSTSDYFEYTGLQVETGKVATPFEHRSYGEELALCQRYFHTLRSGIFGVATAVGTIAFTYSSPVTMRVTPTIGFKDSNDDMRVGDMVAQGHTINTCSIGTTTYSSVESQSWSISGTPSAPQSGNLTPYRTYLLEPQSSNHGTFTFSSEL
jgi:hypothetical protein